jgi:hypothetical protein
VGDPPALLPFAGGAAAYLATWWWLWRKPATGSLVATFEHEVTHALAAWATLHRVTGLRATWRSGGHMTYLGRGNFLIALAPYFLPTLALVAGLLFALVPGEQATARRAVLGAALAYHLTSTLRELHPGQTDLREAGHAFCWAFLPTANLLATGGVVPFAHGGLGSLGAYLADALARTADLVGRVVG